MTAIRSGVGWVLWAIAGAAVLAYVSLGGLAVVELVRLDWLASEPFEFIAVSAVAGSAVVSIGGAVRPMWHAVMGGRAVARLLSSAVPTIPAAALSLGTQLGIADRIDVVASGEVIAVTRGLLRPRILLSTGLLETLDSAELTAVLVHERHHLRRRDPIRLLAGRVFAGFGWFLPLVRWWVRRQALRCELVADRAATTTTGVAAVAGALLKLADLSMPVVAGVSAAGNLPDRVAQLEGQAPSGWARRVWWLTGATLLNLGGFSAAAICCTGLGVMMAGGMS
jgi:Zn-dependent protease with chaperone function